MGIAFNLVITPLFWSKLAPILFTLDWHGLNLITNIHYITTHTIPVISQLVNIYVTKDYIMLPKTWKSLVILGLMYIPCNYLGTVYEGKPLYPAPIDWVDPKNTFKWLCILGLVNTVTYFLTSHLVNCCRGKKPKAS